MTRAARIKALRVLWSRIPDMTDCRGLCADSCRSPFDASALERQVAERRAARPLVPGDGCRGCSMLTAVGRCRIYGDRPTVCRLFGTAPSMACEHGCSPERWLTDGEAMEIICEVFALSEPDVPDGAQIRAYLEQNPQMMPAVLSLLRAR